MLVQRLCRAQWILKQLTSENEQDRVPLPLVDLHKMKLATSFGVPRDELH